MDGEHYFSATPASEAHYRELSVLLNGRTRKLTTANGIFSPGRIDQGTEVLLKYTTRPVTSGNILDLGCGWGPIALSIAEMSPDATVWAVDVNTRALELVQKNADRMGLTNIQTALPDQVPADIAFDSIRSNPPIRIGKAELHAMLQLWLGRLSPGGEAELVVQKNLGSDSLLGWIQESFDDSFVADRLVTAKGFRILRIQRAV